MDRIRQMSVRERIDAALTMRERYAWLKSAPLTTQTTQTPPPVSTPQPTP